MTGVSSYLKQPLLSKVVVPAMIGLAVLLAALWVRIYQIDLRPLHNDEAVNHYFIQQISAQGYYPYSHENYHGPSYFYLTYGLVELFGDQELGLRLSAILVGTLLVPIAWLMLQPVGILAAFLAATLTAFSSSLVFYARYAIHESLFLLATALLALAITRWWRSHHTAWIYLGGIALGLLIATKETFIIAGFSLTVATLMLGDWATTWQELARKRNIICASLILTIILIALFFTGGFQWYGGLREMFLAVPQWIGRNESDTGHFKPWLYYIHILISPKVGPWLNELGLPFGHWLQAERGAEPYLALLLVLPLGWLLLKPRQALRVFTQPEYALGRFLTVWSLSAFLVYSFVSYKTAWLVINISFPALLALTWWLVNLSRINRFTTWLGVALASGIVALTAWHSWYFNFKHTYGRPNPYSYVHTHSGMLQLVSDIENYLKHNPDARILVGVKQYWPLPYYLRNYRGQLGYLHTNNPNQYSNEYQVMILDNTVDWDNPTWGKNYYRLSDAQESHTYFRRSITQQQQTIEQPEGGQCRLPVANKS